MSYRAGFIGFLGLPNAGKSTLLNSLVDEKLSIVSDKPQTTRQTITGIVSREEAQYIFLDAPGTLKSDSGLNPFLKSEVERVLEEADGIALVVGADQEPSDQLLELIEHIKSSKKPWICIVSKSDLKAPKECLDLQAQLRDEGVRVMRVAPQKTPKDTRSRLFEEFYNLIPENPAPLFDTDIYTTETLREIARERIREQCFVYLKKEIPYGLGVRINRFLEDDKVIRIYADILVEKDNHKPILIGGGGSMLKKIGTETRKGLEKLMGTKVFLDLHVQVRKSWTKDAMFLNELGYTKKKES